MTWDDMKVVVRKTFILNQYYCDLHNKLQGLIQGPKSVDKYYKEMEIPIIRVNAEDNRKSTC